MRNARTLLATLVLLLAPAAGPAAAESDSPWPAQIEAGEWTVTIYQPQTESLEGNRLEARAAVSVRRSDGTGEPAFGAVWLSATLDIDRGARLMVVRGLEVPEVRFADATDEHRAALARLLETEIPGWELTFDLDQVVADLGPEAEYATTAGIKNDPPVFVHVTEPAVLLAYDGEPTWQAVAEAKNVERVVNTLFPVVREKGADRSFLYGGEAYWYAAGDPLGPWEPTTRVPKKIRELMKQVARPEEFAEQEQAQPGDESIPPPKIVVATEPTELVVTRGEPQWKPIGDLDLLYCDNTDSDVFLDLATQSYYILVSGRWYAGRAIDGGFAWENVPNDELPDAFAAIPEGSVNGHVLTHVSGTEQAREEALQNTIPQTAAVKRDDASFAAAYDGEPEFEPVEDVPEVRYAVNTSASVFLADGKYWACDNAIWYTSSSATGPWIVATQIPASLYRIPPSNPHHNVTYVHIYETTPQVVYVGYTPGYVGSYWYRGCVVWGTGWYYNPWYGPHYYPRPWTWGLHVHYNPWYGWSFGVSWSNGPFRVSVGWGGGYHGGWYGPGGYRPPYYRPYPPPGYAKPRPTPYGPTAAGRPSQLPSGARPATRPADSLYDRPATRDRVAGTPATRDRARPSQLDAPNDVLTDRSGNVYRKGEGGGWETREGGKWKPAEGLDRPTSPSGAGRPEQQPSTPGARPSQPSSPGTRPSQPSSPGARPSQPAAPGARPSRPSSPGGGATRPQLERDYRSRQRGSERMQQRPSAPRSTPRRR